MTGDFELAGRPRDVENDRLRSIEAKDVEALEGRNVAQQHREPRDELAERGSFRHEAGDRRQ